MSRAQDAQDAYMDVGGRQRLEQVVEQRINNVILIIVFIELLVNNTS